MPLKLNEVEMAKYICILLYAALVAGELVYRLPGVTLDTPENMMCPSDSQLETARDSTSANLSEILINIADNISNTYTIPDCGGSGWRRVAFLNMTDPDQTCPEQWRLYEQGTVRACGRQETNSASCDSVYFSPGETAYTQVCGRITGYSFSTIDSVSSQIYTPTAGNEINEQYLDGVSVTYGMPRQHIWSFFNDHVEERCCYQPDLDFIQSFNIVGDNYFCDTGLTDTGILGTTYPVWDGVTQCPNNANCCAPSSGPWFNTMLLSPSTSDIEVRICADEGTDNEDSPVGLIEFYIQ